MIEYEDSHGFMDLSRTGIIDKKNSSGLMMNMMNLGVTLTRTTVAFLLF